MLASPTRAIASRQRAWVLLRLSPCLRPEGHSEVAAIRRISRENLDRNVVGTFMSLAREASMYDRRCLEIPATPQALKTSFQVHARRSGHIFLTINVESYRLGHKRPSGCIVVGLSWDGIVDT